ncbi:MAG: sulfatase-like hydrolase/transferase [bacterium]|nr:sulfatase-like hydrolase/transferase [bacterium]
MGTKRPFAVDALHLGVLSAFAVAQPLFDLLGNRPEFFAVRRSAPIDMWLLVAVLFLLLPLPLILLEAVARLAHQRLQRMVHGLLCAALITAIALPPLERLLDTGPWPVLCLALLLGVAGAVAIDRLRAARTLLSVMGPLVLVFPAVFLLRPGIGKILRPSEVETAAATRIGTTPIVVLIFDEIPVTSLLAGPNEIDAVRYPNFAALADRATWHRHAMTVSDFTVLAVPAILTGRLPDGPRLPIAPDHPESLFTLLGESYTMNVHESVTQVCPATLCTESGPGEGLAGRLRSLFSDLRLLYLHMLIPEEWTTSLPPVNQNWMLFANRDDWLSDWKQRGRGDRGAQVERLIDGIRPTEVGVLHLMHVLLPHPPFEYLPSGQFYSLEGNVVGLKNGKMVKDEWAVVQNHQRHLLQLGYVDRLLGEIVTRLEEAGLWDPAVVVVTADHGAAFKPGVFNRRVGRANFAEVLTVPLLIKAPGQREGRLDQRPAATIDILPTIADLAGIEIPWEVDGVSFADPATPGRERITIVPHRKPMEEPREIPVDALVTAELEAFSTLEARFGRVEDGGRELFRVGPRRALIGRLAGEFARGAPTDFRYQPNLPYNGLDVEPGGPIVPAHLSGRLVDGEVSEPVELVVVVNGRVAAMTTSWSFAPDHFSAIVDPEAFRAGVNDVEVFALGDVRDKDPGATLRPVPAAAPSPVVGLSEKGLHGVETWAVGPIRWTDGDAEITVAVRRARPPRRLRLTLASTGPDGCRLRLSANGTRLLDSRLEPIGNGETWSTTLDLDGVAFGTRLTVGIKSDTFLPSQRNKDSPDPRRLGVALTGFELLDD